jgi:aspartate aminotransferase
MKNPEISEYYKERKSSIIRSVYEKLNERTDKVEIIDAALGNIGLKMYPALIKRMKTLGDKQSLFSQGIVKYSPATGFASTKKAFLNILRASGLSTKNLIVQITDGASQAIELCLLGVSDNKKTKVRPILLFDPAYTSYEYLAKRLNRKTISISRIMETDGHFKFPGLKQIEDIIRKEKPGAMVVIPYDNPTGQLLTQQQLENLAKLCVKYNMWLISDETYRELYYTKMPIVSVWKLSTMKVPGIEDRIISIESASKIWNACGLRIGAIITNNKEFSEKIGAESTTNVCPNVIGQYIFSALAQEKIKDLRVWFKRQKYYYSEIISSTCSQIKINLPKVIISKPEASLYSVIDFKNISPSFDATDFVIFCAKYGRVKHGKKYYTILMTPLSGFYKDRKIGKSMVRLSYVDTPDKIKLIPIILGDLLNQYLNKI